MLTRIIGLGAGGHARVVLELLRLSGSYDLVGLLDARVGCRGQLVLGVPILGDDSILPSLAKEGVSHFFVGVGTVGDTSPRQRLYALALSHGLQAATATHPSSIVSPSARLAQGTIVMAGAILNACAGVGANVIINTGAIIEHDCSIGDHAHIATGARLAGSVHVERCAHVGAGATVRQGITIGEASIVGAGAVVVKDVPPRTVVAGVPARILQPRGNRGPI